MRFGRHRGDDQAPALPWRDPARFLPERDAVGEAERTADARRVAAEQQQRNRELRGFHDRQRRQAAAASRAERRAVRRARRAARQAGSPAPGSLRAPRAAALWAVAALVLASAAVSFAESYRGLFVWARHHGLSSGWAVIWPLQVDVFIAVGELALFVALADGWKARSRAAAWAVTGIGLAVSVAGNVGHISSHWLTSRATAAVPPLAAAAALAVGLGVLKRVVATRSVPAAPDPPAGPAPAYGTTGAAADGPYAGTGTPAGNGRPASALDEGGGGRTGGQPALPTGTGRDALAAEMADQIRTAAAAGRDWRPDYPALMARTGYRRSWCEKAVRAARDLAAIPGADPGGRLYGPSARTAAPGRPHAEGPAGGDARTGPSLADTTTS